MTVRLATAADVRPLARTLAQAFDDDPVWRWTVPSGATRLGRLERFFGRCIWDKAIGNDKVVADSLHLGKLQFHIVHASSAASEQSNE